MFALVLPIRDRIPRAFRRLLAHLVSLFQSGGRLVRSAAAPFHLSDCGEVSAPCACGWPEDGLAATYTVSGFDGLSPCSGCDADSTDPAWDGTLNHIGAGCVWWAADEDFDPLSMNGVMLDITYTQLLLRTSDPCQWELYIACGSTTNPTKTMWSGYKSGGSTPAGTYTFMGSDCGDATETMTVS